MLFRVLKTHAFTEHLQRKGQEPEILRPGQLIDVLTKQNAERLQANGIIGPRDFSYDETTRFTAASPQFFKTVRIGIWLQTTSWYSGGRIHLYQYAWCLSELGAEVILITEGHPSWANDYPKTPRLKIAQMRKDPIPKDIDLVVTDSKGSFGQMALDYKRLNPFSKFFVWNFETPNWVRKFVPSYADRLNANQHIFQRGDVIICNSRESMKYARDWVGRNLPFDYLPPMINEFAGNKALDEKVKDNWRNPWPKEKYAALAGRAPDYKKQDVAARAINEINETFNLIIVGQRKSEMPDLKGNHKLQHLAGVNDLTKYCVYKNAHFTMAPSLFEGFGMVPAESLSVGTPVIVFDLPVLRQEYGDRKGLIYVPWNDKAKYIETVKRIASEPKIEVDRREIIKILGIDAMKEKIESLPYHTIRKKKVSVQLISYWGFLPESLEAIYPYVNDIWVAHGPVKEVKERGVVDDGSLKLIQDFPDPDKKIRIEKRNCWADKLEMRNWCSERSRGNYLLLLDGDEVWSNFKKWLDKDIDFGHPRWVNFWHNINYWVHDTPKMAGLRWGKRLEPFGSTCPHYRFSYWRRSYRFRTHPVAVDCEGNPLKLGGSHNAEKCKDAIIYHFGHVLNKEMMKAKHQFYKDRDGDDEGRKQREKAWHNWKEGKTGDCGDGIVRKVDWELPAIVRRAFERIKK